MRLLFTRHGRTSSNVRGLLDTAVPGAHLDEEGHRQAERLVERLAAVDVDGLYVSDIVRTQQTVAPLAETRSLTPTILGGLREIPAGEDEMADTIGRYIEVLKRWAHGEVTARHRGGESGVEFFARYDEAIATIADGGHDTALLCSHGAAMRMWLGQRVPDLNPRETARRALGNTAIVTLEGEPGDWHLVSWDEGAETPGYRLQ